MLVRYAFLLVGLLAALEAQAIKRGLLIEIGQYPPGRDTLGTARDVYWMTHTLVRQGFSVGLIANRAACAAGIRHALDSLRQQCRPGDKVIIHYGGHGTQLPDQPGGDETDRRDEALVPYDAPLPDTPGYAQSDRFIRDDELGTYLDRLRLAVGPAGHVLLLIDACHSGTLSRGQGRLRTDNILPAQPPGSPANATTSDWLDRPISSFRTAGATGSVVLIAGAGASQKQYELLDYDNRLVGPIAFGFAEAMLTIDSQTTYNALFNELRVVIRREALRQRIPMGFPTIEGDEQARLLGGDLVLPSFFVQVKLEAQRQFRQFKGGLQGYLPGSTVTVRVARGDGTDSLTGRVVEATPFESVIELTQALPTADSVRLQTSLLSQAFRPGTARVTLDSRVERRTELADWLSAMPGISLVAGEADWLIQPVERGLALCRAGDGEPVETVGPEQLSALPSRLLAYAQADWLRDLTMPTPAMQVDASLVPVKLEDASDRVLATYPIAQRNGLPVLRTDQQAIFTLRNTGTLPCYVTLIDIMPNANVTVVLPNNKYPAASLRLLPGQERIFPLRRIREPLGLETYKLLLSNTPTDLRALVSSRGARTGEAATSHPLTQLVLARFRGTAAPALALTEAGLYTYMFWVDDTKP